VNLGRYRNLLFFVLLANLFGVSFVAIEVGLGTLPPVFFAALRFDVAAVVILGWVALRYDDPLPRTRADWLGVLVSGVFVVAANNVFLFVGQQFTTPAAASVMYGLNPVLAPVFALVLLRQRLSALGIAGILVSLVGVVVIVQPSPASFTGGSAVGQLFVLGAAASVAFGSVLLRRVEPTLPSVPLTGWAMVLASVVGHAGSLALGETVSSADFTALTVLAVLSVGVLSTGIAYPIFFDLIGSMGPVRATTIAYAVPPVAAVTGFLLLGEAVTPATGVGFMIVVAGFALLERQMLSEEVSRLWNRGVPESVGGGPRSPSTQSTSEESHSDD
jgi:drug/metabolite transporter (DMT)-like permease